LCVDFDLIKSDLKFGANHIKTTKWTSIWLWTTSSREIRKKAA